MPCNLLTSEQIHRHPVNDSLSKHRYSFSKAERFPKAFSLSATISYEPHQEITRQAGIGFGHRSTFFDGKKDGPSPTHYQQPSVQKKDRGFSFGAHRDEIKFDNYLTVAENTPAPTAYRPSRYHGSKSYSLKGKNQYPQDYFLPNESQQLRSAGLPGPGYYEAIDKLGSPNKTMLSTHIDTKGKLTSKGERFSGIKMSPGPSDYNYGVMQQPDGIYTLSTMRSNGRRAILNEKRVLKLEGNRETPGPGQYMKPSDFGVYGICDCNERKGGKGGKKTRPQTARK